MRGFVSRVKYENLLAEIVGIEWKLAKRNQEIAELKEKLTQTSQAYAVYLKDDNPVLEGCPIIIKGVSRNRLDCSEKWNVLYCYDKSNNLMASFVNVLYFMPCEESNDNAE